jgi:hypothetical protein
VVVADFKGGVRPPLIKAIPKKAVESHSGSPRLFLFCIDKRKAVKPSRPFFYMEQGNQLIKNFFNVIQGGRKNGN